MEHVGYHGTTAAFSRFSEEMFGSASDRSPNGALGVWVFTDRSYADHYAKGAGGRTLCVKSTAAKAIKIDANQMRRDHMSANETEDPIGWFRQMRAELLLNGFGRIDVQERDGSIGMSVLIDPASIVSVEEITH